MLGRFRASNVNEAASGILFYVQKRRKQGFGERGSDLEQQPWADSIYAEKSNRRKRLETGQLEFFYPQPLSQNKKQGLVGPPQALKLIGETMEREERPAAFRKTRNAGAPGRTETR